MRILPNSRVSIRCCWMLTLVICLIFISCGHSQQPSSDPPLPEAPKALEEESSLDGGSFKRSNESLVERLYEDVIKKDTQLAAFENHLKKLSEMKSDSTEKFNTYDDKSDNYYRGAAGLIGEIRDTVLKKRMADLVAGSDSAYQKLTVKQRKFLAGVQVKQQALADLRIMLMLTRTLPLMERYQKSRLPGDRSLENLLAEYDKVVKGSKELREKK